MLANGSRPRLLIKNDFNVPGRVLAARQHVRGAPLFVLLVCGVTVGCASAVPRNAQAGRLITSAERAALIRRAQLWSPTIVAEADMVATSCAIQARSRRSCELGLEPDTARELQHAICSKVSAIASW